MFPSYVIFYVFSVIEFYVQVNDDITEPFLHRVEVYSARTVPKNLAGKPEGWNSE